MAKMICYLLILITCLFIRSTPCPHVKHSDEWGEPSSCESGDNCPYCHTRTEQQFHPEVTYYVYKHCINNCLIDLDGL